MTTSLRRFRPLEYAVGTDGTITIELQDFAGDALDVTGASAVWNVYKAVPRRRDKPFTGSVLLAKTSATGQIALATGLATITLLDSDFSSLSGQHFHVLSITDASGNISRLGQGDLFLIKAG